MYTFNCSRWSACRSVSGSTDLTSVSCATTSFCVATASNSAYVFNGTTWSGATQVSEAGLAAVSCPSATFCMALDGSEGAHIYNGTTWSSRQMPSWGWRDVSCSSSTFCAAFTVNGDEVFTFDGTSWGASTPLDISTFSVISCAAARTCVVVNQDGQAFYSSAP